MFAWGSVIESPINKLSSYSSDFLESDWNPEEGIYVFGPSPFDPFNHPPWTMSSAFTFKLSLEITVSANGLNFASAFAVNFEKRILSIHYMAPFPRCPMPNLHKTTVLDTGSNLVFSEELVCLPLWIQRRKTHGVSRLPSWQEHWNQVVKSVLSSPLDPVFHAIISVLSAILYLPFLKKG